MADVQDITAGSEDPEKAHVLVRGDCDHIFPVPLARLGDGAEFVCPVCGQTDRFDEDALQAAQEELEELRSKGPLHELGQRVSDFFSNQKPKDQ